MVKAKKVLNIFIILLTVLMLISITGNSLALFETEGTATIEQETGKWTIKVNDIKVTGVQKQFTIDNFIYEKNEYVNDNKIAPGGNCYFDLVIDASKTDVSVKYIVDFDFSLISNYDFIEPSVVNLSEGEVIKTGKNQFTGVIDLDSIKREQTSTIRVNLKWISDEANNENDSKLGLEEDAKLSIPVNINLIQYTGEEIVPYNE